MVGKPTRNWWPWAVVFIMLVLVLVLGVRYPVAPAPGPELAPAIQELGTTHFTNIQAEDITATDDLVVTDDVTLGDDVAISGDVDVNGGKIDLDADADTSITADTDDEIDFELNGSDQIIFKTAPAASGYGTTNMMEIAGSSPAWITSTNALNFLDIDIGVGNAVTGTHTVRGIMIDGITGDAQVTETGIEIGSGFDVGADVNGLKIVLDADADTSITADTDDQIDIELSGADDFRFTANTFTALSGSTIAANTIAETTAANGVAVDGLTIRDGGLIKQDQAKTASYSVAATDNGDLFTNIGATAEVTFTLPTAAEGLNYCFYVGAAYTVTIELDGSDQVHHLTNAAGDRVQNAGTAGDSLCIQAIDATYWVPVHETGTWADAN